MKTFSTFGAVIGAIGVLLSPQVMSLLTGTQVFYLLLVALVLALIGESVIPAIKGRQPQKEDDKDGTA